MANFQEHQDNKTHEGAFRKMVGTLSISEEDWKPYISPQVASTMELPPLPVIVEEQEEWEVAQILDSQLKRGTSWYLVEWKGFNEDPERRTWEPDSNLTNSQDLVKDFHTLYPDKPGPNASRV
ncbi:hypothetical protein O181_097734 [Austropuccinia psidii MF-1]|uniref:Chromo domain-containing protein n=1 Tax=Austropuccinia psidii MF-1 TaxID=1389203 RepID=A0A9Q3PDV6_9BASI|nr:hypothetical protein [Austropuccinia psidii MF-1]